MPEPLYNEEIVDAPIPPDMTEPVSMPRLYSNLQQATNSITISPLQDIQKAIDAIANLGGGTINLQAGTYYPKNDITMRGNCRIIGENSITTIINFNSQPYSLIYPGIFGSEVITNMQTERIRVINSTTNGIEVQDNTNNVIFKYVDARSNGGDGFNVLSLGGGIFESCNSVSNNGNGISLLSATRILFTGLNATNSNGINGLLFTACSYIDGYDVLSQSNANDGLSIVQQTADSRLYNFLLGGNGRYGININNSSYNNIHDSVISTSTSDGIRIDTDANRNRITDATIISNSGWGVKINNVNCDKNLLAFCDLGSIANTSGTLSDGGTGTVSVNHIT